MINATIRLYKNAYSGLNRNIWLLSLVMLVNRSGTMVLAFMTLYCKYLGYSMEKGGVVVAIYGAGATAGAVIGGKLSDKIGFDRLQFGALFLGGLMFLLLGQMETYLSICICTFILAMVNESFRPANASAVAYYSEVKNRTQSFSLIRLAINIGFGIGIAIGGLLAAINYHLLFWVDGCTSILAAGLLKFLLPKVKTVKAMPVAASEGLTVEKAPLKDAVFMWFLFFQLLFGLCFFQLFTTIPLFFKEKLQLSEFWIGVVMSINGIIIAILEMVLVYKIEGRRPYLQLISIGCVLMGISFLSLNIPLASGLMVALLATVVITFSEMLSMPFMNSYYLSLSGERNRGQYAGMYTMTWSIAQVIGSGTGGLFAEAFGFDRLWYLVCALCLVAALGYYGLQRKVKMAAALNR